MKKIQIVLLVVIVIGITLIFTQKFWVDDLVNFILRQESKNVSQDNLPQVLENENKQDTVFYNLIKVDRPREGESIQTPFVVEGEARGQWYFEATFPIVLVDWDGRIIAQSYAQAQGEWMTENFVPYNGVINFESPYKPGDPDFMKRGAIILQKSNPSDLPENDAAVEIPIMFE